MKTAMTACMRSGLLTALLAAVSACGAPSESGEDATPRLDDTAPSVTAGEGETVCQTRVLGVDEFGHQVVDPEIYSFPKMNEKLNAYPELQAATGLATVSDCEGARAFIRGYNEYASANPDFGDSGPSKQEVVEAFLDAQAAEPPTLPVEGAPGAEIPKIFNGTITTRLSLNLISWLPDRTKNLARYCSATRLAGPLFLMFRALCAEPDE